MTTMPIVGPEAYSPAWFSLRLFDPERNPPVVFGASEAAIACGRSRYKQPLHLYLVKRGLQADDEETEAMAMGRDLEPGVLNVYGRKSGSVPWTPAMTGSFQGTIGDGTAQTNNMLDHYIAQPPLYLHYDHPYIGATPDAIRYPIGLPHFPVDAKTASWFDAREFGEDGTDELPDEYVLQAQQQMLVLGAERCDLPVLFSTRHLRIYTVQRHEGLIEHIQTALAEMYERILQGDPPPPNWEHPHTPRLVKDLYGAVNEGLTIYGTEDHSRLWQARQQAAAAVRAAQDEYEKADAEFRFAMGDAAVLRLPLGQREIVRKKVTVREHVRKENSHVRITERTIG